MASTSYNPDGKVEENPYPYPSNLCAANFISVKLSGRDKYDMWEAQMRCLLESHDMLGFIDGTFIAKEIEMGDKNYRLWRRSDAVVKGWILGSLSEETLSYVLLTLREKNNEDEDLHERVEADVHAKCVWDELQNIYNPQRASEDLPVPEEEPVGEVQKALHQAIKAGHWDDVDRILREGQVTVTDKITPNGNTALHEAASTTKKREVIENLLKNIPDNKQLWDVRNSDGSTPLHVAAMVNNHNAAYILVNRDPNLLWANDCYSMTPLDLALLNMDKTMYSLLLNLIKGLENHPRFAYNSGAEDIVLLIFHRDYFFAGELLGRYTTLDDDMVLNALALNFPNECNIFEKCIDSYGRGAHVVIKRAGDIRDSVETMLDRCVPSYVSWVKIIPLLFLSGIQVIVRIFSVMLQRLVWPLFITGRSRGHDEAKKLLTSVCELIRGTKEPCLHRDYYKEAIFGATRQNAYEVVEDIVRCFPTAISSTNEDGHNIIQYAVINRSEMVYNLVYQMSTHKNVYRKIMDSCDNNLLHLAGKLAPTNKLELISGEFLQIQSELQWFKEVKGFVSPLLNKQKNYFGETPQMVFTREHKELLIQGEKWLKATAESYTITTALITTIVFAAAITVPGGNDQDTGIPVFANNNAFTVFAISDAISLFAAITSLLMFLSILTTRFAEQDFLYKLPTKLIIGLVTLFISTTTMIIAAGATLYLVFGQSNSKILITIIVSTSLPIAAFVTLQSRLIIDLMSATYGRSIFGKKRDRPFC